MKRVTVTGLLDEEDLAKALRVSRRVVGDMRRAKKIPAVKLGHRTIRFNWEEVVAALKARSDALDAGEID